MGTGKKVHFIRDKDARSLAFPEEENETSDDCNEATPPMTLSAMAPFLDFEGIGCAISLDEEGRETVVDTRPVIGQLHNSDGRSSTVPSLRIYHSFRQNTRLLHLKRQHRYCPPFYGRVKFSNPWRQKDSRHLFRP